ncbi:MAG: hypothetical protein LBF01_02265 [Bacteroidales bacterium]|jgi:hypothetical protein|nr:hypothetical protein [Bacteroidales bacterium]
MKHYLLLLALLLAGVSVCCSQRSMHFYSDGNISYRVPVSDVDSVKFVNFDDEFGITNSRIRVMQDITRGGAICHISVVGDSGVSGISGRSDVSGGSGVSDKSVGFGRSGYSGKSGRSYGKSYSRYGKKSGGSGVGRNLVNIADEGRYIQQSYYAGNSLDRTSEGQSPSWSPWTWNPIQAGDYALNRAKILVMNKTDTSTYIKCIPMLWDMDNMPAEATMEQWTSVSGNVISVHNRLTCNRTDDIYGEGIDRDQELPAVYLISALDNLYSYFGSVPFSGEAASTTEIVQLESGFWGIYDNTANPFPSEKWMAFVDDNGFGVGVYSPSATKFLAGRYGWAGDEEWSPATNYIAPVCVRALMKNSVFEYKYWLAVGTLDEIRAAFYQIYAGE